MRDLCPISSNDNKPRWTEYRADVMKFYNSTCGAEWLNTDTNDSKYLVRGMDQQIWVQALIEIPWRGESWSKCLEQDSPSRGAKDATGLSSNTYLARTAEQTLSSYGELTIIEQNGYGGKIASELGAIIIGIERKA